MATTQQTRRPDTTLSTLDKGLRILELLATDEADDGLTLTELGRRLGMHRTTLFRFLATLRTRGYVERDPATDRYTLGLGVLALASRQLSSLDIRHAARPALVALRDELDEMVHLTILDNDEVMTIERVEGRHPVSLQTEIGARRPVYCTASGKSILAFLSEADQERILARPMPAITAHTLRCPEMLRAQLATIRQSGVAIDDEERTEGVRCVASPIFDFDRRVAGAISLAAPISRMPDDQIAHFGARVLAAAEAASRQLGYAGAWFSPISMND